jgi:hypothetical protein
VHERAIEWADRRVRGGLIELSDDLPELLEDMCEIELAANVADAVLSEIHKGAYATQGAIVFDGDVVGARAVEPDAVQHFLARWTPPLRAGNALERDPHDASFPVRVRLQRRLAAGRPPGPTEPRTKRPRRTPCGRSPNPSSARSPSPGPGRRARASAPSRATSCNAPLRPSRRGWSASIPRGRCWQCRE